MSLSQAFCLFRTEHDQEGHVRQQRAKKYQKVVHQEPLFIEEVKRKRDDGEKLTGVFILIPIMLPATRLAMGPVAAPRQQ